MTLASRDLAAAAREDGSAMKTIVVLTMASLPGTFFAALLPLPHSAGINPNTSCSTGRTPSLSPCLRLPSG
ncbi:hypothetical protein SMAC4_13689 [Sordaria macrospora]|uniref:uncharacterized protein n=1 Tax=Sordaria macrospora TaxID=5147 RepID=UPI002B2D2622|nr:hypothetical protein SMAC4_13689 [Sordaria macrospora]